jgi:hypothetical protein
MNSLKSRAMNCGPLSEMIRGLTSGYRSRARWMIVSMSASVIRWRIGRKTVMDVTLISKQHREHGPTD